MRRRRAAAAAAALLLATGVASGNGRAPLTNGIHFQPGDPHSLYVATTFGLLVSHDDGCTFDWVCEDNVGYGGMYDPQYAIASDGTIFATTYTGLRVSRDGGCSFQTATDQLPQGDPGRLDLWVNGLAIGPDGIVWIATSDSAQPNAIYASTDDGVTFAKRGTVSPSILWNAIKVAPARAQRVYATGHEVVTTGDDAGQTYKPHLVISDDAGQTWTESPLAGVTYGGLPSLRVLAVDPQNPQIVYVASEGGANPPDGDLLYRSTDGGMTLTQVLATTQVISDLAIPDAQHVIVATASSGSFESTDAGMTFSPMAGTTPQLSCLGVSDDGKLIGCGTNWMPDNMSVTKSTDLGASWQKVWRFVQLDGPLQCPAGTAEHDICDVQRWPTLQQQFGATGPTCGSHVWPTDPEAPLKHGGGCCDAGGGGATSLALGLALALALSRRRRDQPRFE